MTEGVIICQPEVRLRDVSASDMAVIEAMLVSTQGSDTEDYVATLGDGGVEGRIRFLMKGRHGSPFEHNLFKFYVKAPLAVFREHHRHRIGWSYNEESGRYKKLKPEFYIPPPERPLVQVGKPGAYRFVEGTHDQYQRMYNRKVEAYRLAYGFYEEDLADGIALEVARGVLPVYIMSSMYCTCNARSMMAFLSLRTDEPESTFPSKPMWEIDRLVARVYEEALATHMPATYAAFNVNGRVGP